MNRTTFFKPNRTKLIPNRIRVFLFKTKPKPNRNKITIPHIPNSNPHSPSSLAADPSSIQTLNVQ